MRCPVVAHEMDHGLLETDRFDLEILERDVGGMRLRTSPSVSWESTTTQPSVSEASANPGKSAPSPASCCSASGLERNALVWPSLVPHDGSAWIGGVQIGIALGFLGLFVMVISFVHRIFPTLPIPKD